MKKSIFIAAAVFYLASPVQDALAQRSIPATGISATSNEPLSVQYLGSQDEYLLFRVEIKTGNVNRSVFKVEDSIEGELYSNTINSNAKYQLVKVEKRDNQVLDFKLVSANKVYTKTFTTDRNDKLYQKGVAVL